MSKFLSYEQSGVSIDANDQMVQQIWSAVVGTFGPRVIESKGGFAGMFRLDYDEKLFKRNYKNPVLIACTDGVGSKVQLAAKIKIFDTVGIDLVAMSVNDMLVAGAEPLFFLDYIAVHKLEPKIITELVQGVAAGCRQADCALIGGETAEMPDTYAKGDFDMAGFAVGVLERDKIINGENVRNGDVILGLASNGIHSNGYSLVRKIFFEELKMSVEDYVEEFGRTLGEELLEPTRIYSRTLTNLRRDFHIYGVSHITGGGLIDNIPRILPRQCKVIINTSSWTPPPVFLYLQKAGKIPMREMLRTFNNGLGLVIVVREEETSEMLLRLKAMGETAYLIGSVESRDDKEEAIQFTD